jgi:hypothetical protein
MHPASFGITTNHGMTPPADFEAMLDFESRDAITARSMHHLPDPNRGRSQLTFA